MASVMETTITQRIVIEGGSLPRGSHWVPDELSVVGGEPYIPLSHRDRKLAAYCGIDRSVSSPFKDCAWMLGLKLRRNEVVLDAATQAATEQDVIGALGGNIPLVRKFSKIDFDSLPNHVYIDMPAVELDGERVEAMRLRVLVESDPKRMVRLHLDPSSLSYIRLAIRESCSRGESVVKRRKFIDRISCEVPHVMFDYRRQSLYTNYTDQDGREKRKYQKPEPMDEATLHAAALVLQGFRQKHHCGDEDDEVGDEVERDEAHAAGQEDDDEHQVDA